MPVEWYVKALVDGRRVDREGIVDRVLREAQRTLERSSTGFYRGDPKTFRGLDDHYYDVPVDGPGLVDALERTVRALLWHPVVERLVDVPQRIREVEQLSRIRLWGVDVWLSPDVVVADGRGGLVVVDWKTGRAHEGEGVNGQLGLYAIYVLDRYLNVRVDGPRGALPLGRVRGLVAHTGEEAFRNRSITEGDIAAVRSAILGSLPAMRGGAENREDDIPSPTGFPMVPPDAGTCATCSFRRTCARE